MQFLNEIQMNPDYIRNNLKHIENFEFKGKFINKNLTKNLIKVFCSNPKELYAENSFDCFIAHYLKLPNIYNNYHEYKL